MTIELFYRTQHLKLLHVSDTHLGLDTFGTEDPSTGINSRSNDGLMAFKSAIDYAIQNDIELVLHSGDCFNTKNPSQNIVNAVYAEIKRALDAGIKFFMLTGNHDNSKILTRKTSLDLANTLDIKNLTITRGNSFHDFGNIQIVTIGYWNEISEIQNIVDDLAKKVDWSRPAMLLGHLQVQYADFPGSFKHDLPFVPLEYLTSHPWLFSQLGHIHKPQILAEKPFTFYVGSLVRCSAAEANDKKGFWVSEIENNKLKSIKQIEVDCLQYQTIKGTPKEIHSILEQINGQDLSKLIIRLQVDESDEPLDMALIREKLTSAFKYTIQKEPKKKEIPKIKTMQNLSLDNYLEHYFEKDEDKNDLFKVFHELQSAAEVK